MPHDPFAKIDARHVLMAYDHGVFPMAEGRDDPLIFFVDPERRGVMPLDGFRLSRSLAKVIRRGRFEVTLNQDFAGVVAGCADRDETWISPRIAAIYQELHAAGWAHSIEVRRDGELVGGLYGVTKGAAFFGESMFSAARDASKVAMAYTVALLRRQGFVLFDTQFLTEHLASLGAIEIPREAYRAQLRKALMREAVLEGPMPQSEEGMQLRSQTS